jgi:Rrf2 family protein
MLRVCAAPGCETFTLGDHCAADDRGPAQGDWARGRPYYDRVRVSAKADYAIRAMVELAAAGGGPVKAERIAQAQSIPIKFLENIMGDLRQSALVRSQRGTEGGYWLARPAEEISLADVIRAVEGPLANVRGRRSEEVEFEGSAVPLREVWIAVRASLRAVLESVTLADVARGELPDAVAGLTADAEAWLPH